MSDTNNVIAVYDGGGIDLKNACANLDVDQDGYGEFTLGALDCLSNKNEFYVFNEAVKQIFSPNSWFMVRLRNKSLRGELEHPSPKPTDTLESFLNRVKTILLSNVSHKIKHIELREGKDEYGKRVVLIVGRVKPSGRYGYVLENLIKDPEENIMFSIRSMSKRWKGPDGRYHKQLTTPVTFDLVNDGGIRFATRYTDPANAVAMESALSNDDDMSVFYRRIYEDVAFTEHDLQRAEEAADQLAEAVGMESESAIDFAMIRDGLGWNKVQRITPRSAEHW